MKKHSAYLQVNTSTQSHPLFSFAAPQVSRPLAIIATLLISMTALSLTCIDNAHAGLDYKLLAHKAPSMTLSALEVGEPQEVIVVFDDLPILSKVTKMRTVNPDPSERQAIRDYQRQALRRLKQEVLAAISGAEAILMQDYSHLPMTSMRVDSLRGLNQLLDEPRVARVYENRKNRMYLSETLPLIRQPEAKAAGYSGGGTVAVVDSGVDYTNAAFGACTAPGDRGCRVVFAQDFAPEDGELDEDGHGTNVAATVLGVAPRTKIAALDVFDGRRASDAWILDAIDWTIANQQTYDIVALNLSLGGYRQFATECVETPYTKAFAAVREAGILPTVAAGNEASKHGVSVPACAPGALSVGAVYDSTQGPIEWSSCPDFSTDADQVTCFSNSAPILTLLAPGVWTTAADIKMGGTSQAAPHVAGAVAVLRNAFPDESLEQTVARMTNNGVPITDPANGLTHPRLDLMAAIEGENTTPPPSSVKPLELLSPLGTINTTYPEYQWGAVAQVDWYYLAILDSSYQTVVADYLYPERLDCDMSICRTVPNVELNSGENYFWLVYAWKGNEYEKSDMGEFNVARF